MKCTRSSLNDFHTSCGCSQNWSCHDTMKSASLEFAQQQTFHYICLMKVIHLSMAMTSINLFMYIYLTFLLILKTRKSFQVEARHIFMHKICQSWNVRIDFDMSNFKHLECSIQSMCSTERGTAIGRLQRLLRRTNYCSSKKKNFFP